MECRYMEEEEAMGGITRCQDYLMVVLVVVYKVDGLVSMAEVLLLDILVAPDMEL